MMQHRLPIAFALIGLVWLASCAPQHRGPGYARQPGTIPHGYSAPRGFWIPRRAEPAHHPGN